MSDTEAFADRLRWVMDQVGGPGQLQRASGISRRLLDKYAAADTAPGLEKLLAIARGAGVRVGWLAAGEGDAALGGHPTQAAQNEVRVPVVYTGDSGGEAPAAFPVATELVQTLFWADTSTDITFVVVNDDTMAPTLSPQDWVIVDVGEGGLPPQDGIFCLRFSGTIQLKRIKVLPGHRLQVISDNQLYPPFTLDPDNEPSDSDFAVIGQVVGGFHKFV